jgi:hypothetical protein
MEETMERSAPAGRPQITVVNGTRCPIWVAIYKRRSLLHGNEPPVAWQVASPPPRGKTSFFVPRDYQVCARYSFEPENSRRPVYQTNSLQVPHLSAGAGFLIESVTSLDRRTWGAVLTRTAESPGWYRIRIANRFSIGVSIHVRMEGREIFAPRIVPPMAALIEDLDSPFYMAVLPLPRADGDRLLDSEVALTEIAVRAGESVKVQGGPRKGFEISRRDEKQPVKERKQEPASRRRERGKTRKASSRMPLPQETPHSAG